MPFLSTILFISKTFICIQCHFNGLVILFYPYPEHYNRWFSKLKVMDNSFLTIMKYHLLHLILELLLNVRKNPLTISKIFITEAPEKCECQCDFITWGVMNNVLNV